MCFISWLFTRERGQCIFKKYVFFHSEYGNNSLSYTVVNNHLTCYIYNQRCIHNHPPVKYTSECIILRWTTITFCKQSLNIGLNHLFESGANFKIVTKIKKSTFSLWFKTILACDPFKCLLLTTHHTMVTLLSAVEWKSDFCPILFHLRHF